MSRRLVVEIIGDPASLQAALGKASASATEFSGRMDTMKSRFEHVGRSAMIFGGAVTAVGGELGVKLAESAMQAQEQTGKLDVALQNAGLSAAKMKPQIDALAASGRKLGFTNSDVRDSLTKLVTSGESVGAATKNMALAADLARYKNISLADASQALIKLHAGNTRALKDLGIVLPGVTSHVAALRAEHIKTSTAAGAHALKVAELKDKLATAAQGVQILSDRVHGQAQEYADSAAGGMAQFRAQIGNLSENLGTLLLPTITKLTGFLSMLADKFQSLSPGMQKAIAIGGAVAVGIGVLAVAIGAIAEVCAGAITAIEGLSTAMAFLAANPLVLVGIALVAVGVALYEAWEHSATFRRIVTESFDAVKGVVESVAHFITVTIPNAFKSVLSWVESNWPIIATVIAGPFAPLVALATNAFGIRDKLEAAFAAIKNAVSAAIGDVVSFVRKLPGEVVSALGDLSHLLFSAGKDLIEGMIHGMESAAGGLVGKAKSLVDKAKNALEFWKSPPDHYGSWLAGEVTRGMTEGFIQYAAPTAAASRTVVAQIVALFNSYVPAFRASGVSLGHAFADGIRASIDDAIKAAEQLAQSVSQYMPHSPAEKGPLSRPIGWSSYLMDGLAPAAAGVVAALAAGLAIPSIPVHAPAGVAAQRGVSVGSGAGAAPQINVTVNVPSSFIGSEQELVDALSKSFFGAGSAGHPLWAPLVRAARQ